MTLPAHQNQALLTLLVDWQRDVLHLLGQFRVRVAGRSFELPLSHSWQPIPGVPGVEMAALDPADWPANAEPGSDYHLLRGPGNSASPGVLTVEQAIRLEILEGHQRYWTQRTGWRDYRPGDAFECRADEGHQWTTSEPFFNRVQFSPAISQAK